MGHRLEIFTDATTDNAMIEIAAALGIEAKLVGRVEAAEKASLHLHTIEGEIIYEY